MSPIFDNNPAPVQIVNGCVLSGLATSESDTSLEAWIAALCRLTDDQDRVVRARSRENNNINNTPREITGPLTKVAEGPWRSLGGFFDYTHWADRDRFMELDRAIAAGQDSRDFAVEAEIEHWIAR